MKLTENELNQLYDKFSSHQQDLLNDIKNTPDNKHDDEQKQILLLSGILSQILKFKTAINPRLKQKKEF